MNFENKKKLIAILENFNQPSNDATPALIDFMFKDYEDNVVMKAALEVVKAKGRLSLGDIKQYLEPQIETKTSASTIAQRAFALLRYPQRDGESEAAKSDPEAYSLLMEAGRWYDLHTRVEDPRSQRDLKFELKALAEQQITTQKTQAVAQLAAPKPKVELPAPKPSEEIVIPKIKEDWMF